MYLEIYHNDVLVNTFEDLKEVKKSFVENLFVVANKTNKTKMKVINHMDGTATIKFYLDMNYKYIFKNVPYHCGYLGNI